MKHHNHKKDNSLSSLVYNEVYRETTTGVLRPGDKITEVGLSWSTLYNELSRNKGGRGYRPRQAQKFSEQRRAAKVQPLKMGPEVTRLH